MAGPICPKELIRRSLIMIAEDQAWLERLAGRQAAEAEQGRAAAERDAGTLLSIGPVSYCFSGAATLAHNP